MFLALLHKFQLSQRRVDSTAPGRVVPKAARCSSATGSSAGQLKYFDSTWVAGTGTSSHYHIGKMMEESVMCIYICVCVWRWMHPGFLIYIISFALSGLKRMRSRSVFLFPLFVLTGCRDVTNSGTLEKWSFPAPVIDHGPIESFHKLSGLPNSSGYQQTFQQWSQPCSHSPIWGKCGKSFIDSPYRSPAWWRIWRWIKARKADGSPK